MKKKTKVVAPYAVNPKTGEGKSLRYEADFSDKDEADFTSDLEAVAATKPGSLGELLERLASLQKANLPK